MNNNNLMVVSGGLLMAIGLNDIYTLVAILAITLGVLSTLITLVVKFVKFIKDGKLTREEQDELVKHANELAEQLKNAQQEIDVLKKNSEQDEEVK